MRVDFFIIPVQAPDEATANLNRLLSYARLRDLREQLAQTEGVPPQALFTNERLAAPG